MTGHEPAAKAVTYLTDGRVRVRHAGPDGYTVDVLGSQPTPYTVTRPAGHDWACNCPATTRACCHVLAAALICGPDPACAPHLPNTWPWPAERRGHLHPVETRP